MKKVLKPGQDYNTYIEIPQNYLCKVAENNTSTYTLSSEAMNSYVIYIFFGRGVIHFSNLKGS